MHRSQGDGGINFLSNAEEVTLEKEDGKKRKMHLIFHIGEYPETASAMCIIELPSTQLPSKSFFSGLLEVLRVSY